MIAGAMAAWVPQSLWQAFFLHGHPFLAKLWGPVVGPIVAIVSFVCSVGNVPLAAVLWNGGISFGGVVAFLFADLIILPILNIYRKYYGLKISLLLLVLFYAAMSLSALAVEYVFGFLRLIPEQRHVQIVEAAIRWNYTNHPQHHLPGSRDPVGRSFSSHRRSGHAPHDEHALGRR